MNMTTIVVAMLITVTFLYLDLLHDIKILKSALAKANAGEQSAQYALQKRIEMDRQERIEKEMAKRDLEHQQTIDAINEGLALVALKNFESTSPVEESFANAPIISSTEKAESDLALDAAIDLAMPKK